jgi:hypothetical protein
MSDAPKQRGGSATARRLGLVGVVVHLAPAEHAAVKEAAEAAGLTAKEFCRRALLKAAGLEPEPWPDRRGSGHPPWTPDTVRPASEHPLQES